MNTAPLSDSLDLSALDGANPLGFLAALGTLLILLQAGHTAARLGWRQKTHWIPVIHGLRTRDPQQIAEDIAGTLREKKEIAENAEAERESAERDFNAAKKILKEKLAEIKKRKLRGTERISVFEKEVKPLESTLKEKRNRWLTALKEAVPSEELAIGKHIDCTADEYREHAATFLNSSTYLTRTSVDFLATFGSDAAKEKSGRIVGTPFCFITGSGHQYFLDTVRQLIEQASAERIHQTLFRSWEYRDEKLSMRWDPIEDRRYALMDRDPTASDNKSRTVWIANLLAYRGLLLFPSAITAHGLRTTAWALFECGAVFTWPIWERPLDLEVIRSLLQMKELQEKELELKELRARGIVATFRSQRIQVGNPPLHKINFTPARSLL